MKTPASLPYDAKLSLQFRVRHPRRGTTVEHLTINARAPKLCLDFGRWPNTDDGQIAGRKALQQSRLDLLARRFTAFGTFQELLDAPYTPTLRDERLATAYDIAQAERDDNRRAAR